MRITFREEALDLIRDVIAGDLSVDDFQDAFLKLQLTDRGLRGTTQDEEALISEILEKLSYTDRDPDKRSRQEGWISNEEFVIWLRAKIAH